MEHYGLFGRFADDAGFGKQSFVYVIRNRRMNLYKIGHTDNVNRRLKELQRTSAHTLDLWVAWQCSALAARAFEATAHVKFVGYRTHGEWFQLDEEQAWDIRRAESWRLPAYQVHPVPFRGQLKREPLRASPFHVHLL